MMMRRQPLTSFAILFFFLNHAVESSILPLEMVYEHRNYLPSMFLFLPVADGFWRILTYYRSQKSQLYYILIGFVLIYLGHRGKQLWMVTWSIGLIICSVLMGASLLI